LSSKESICESCESLDLPARLNGKEGKWMIRSGQMVEIGKGDFYEFTTV
jgi:hypothetical protein